MNLAGSEATINEEKSMTAKSSVDLRSNKESRALTQLSSQALP